MSLTKFERQTARAECAGSQRKLWVNIFVGVHSMSREKGDLSYVTISGNRVFSCETFSYGH